MSKWKDDYPQMKYIKKEKTNPFNPLEKSYVKLLFSLLLLLMQLLSLMLWLCNIYICVISFCYASKFMDINYNNNKLNIVSDALALNMHYSLIMTYWMRYELYIKVLYSINFTVIRDVGNRFRYDLLFNHIMNVQVYALLYIAICIRSIMC